MSELRLGKIDSKNELTPGSKTEAMLCERQESIVKLKGPVQTASDEDLQDLTKSVNNSWSDLQTLSTFSTLDHSEMRKIARKPLEIDAKDLAKVNSGEVTVTSLVKSATEYSSGVWNSASNKVSETVNGFYKWWYGDKTAVKPGEVKTAQPADSNGLKKGPERTATRVGDDKKKAHPAPAGGKAGTDAKPAPVSQKPTAEKAPDKQLHIPAADKKPAQSSEIRKVETKPAETVKEEAPQGEKAKETSEDKAKEAKEQPEAKSGEKQGDEAQAGIPTAEHESNVNAADVLDGLSPEALKIIWDAVVAGGGLAATVNILPSAVVGVKEIVFSVVNNADESAEADGKKPMPTRLVDIETGGNIKAHSMVPDDKSMAPQATPPKTADAKAGATTDGGKQSAAPKEGESSAKPSGDKSAPTLEQNEKGALYQDKDKGVKITKEGDVIKGTVTNPETGATGEATKDGAEVSISEDGTEIYRQLSALDFQAGKFLFKDGVITKEDGSVMISQEMLEKRMAGGVKIFFPFRAKTLDEALKHIERTRPDALKGKDTLVVYYDGGGAFIHPQMDRLLEFKSKNGKATEFYYDLGDGKKLRGDADGTFYFIKDDVPKQLTADQKKKFLESLGEKGKIIEQMIGSIIVKDKLMIDMPDGTKKDAGSGTTITVPAAPASPENKDAPQMPTKITILNSGEIKVIAENDKEKITFGVDGESIYTEETKATPDKPAEIIKIDARTMDFETNKLIRKNGVTTQKSTGINVNEKGELGFPDGTKVAANGDIHFANGSTLFRDGTLVTADGRIHDGGIMGAPKKANLDAIVSSALGLARSIAGRASGGNISPSEIKLLEASLSVLCNFINVFSLMGNLPQANQLFGSYGLVKDSLGKAQDSANRQGADAAEKEREVRSFLKNLETSSASGQEKAQVMDAVNLQSFMQTSAIR